MFREINKADDQGCLHSTARKQALQMDERSLKTSEQNTDPFYSQDDQDNTASHSPLERRTSESQDTDSSDLEQSPREILNTDI